MKRIAIIGCSGAGKSSVSRKLHKLTRLPLYHLDQYYWKPNWTETEKAEWTEIVTTLAAQDQWIIDGNYGGTMDIRFLRADTVVLLKYSTLLCLQRVMSRTWKHLGKVRPDMPAGCNERFNLNFLHYVATYNLVRVPTILNKLDRIEKEHGVKIFISHSDQETETIVQTIQEQFIT